MANFTSTYIVGGCLYADAPTYVVRSTDAALDAALRLREFSAVLSPRQMGKSSLLVRVKERLQAEGARCACLDMSRLSHPGLTRTQWYTGMIMSLLQSLNPPPPLSYHQGWQPYQDLAPVQRLHQLVEEVLLPEAAGPPLYIFINEIDSLLSLDFAIDDFFAWMGACYERRAHDPRYRRLSFALSGVATPADLIADQRHPPFPLGQALVLPDFTLATSAPLQPGLEPWVSHPAAVLQSILDWTGGQPFLTQKLCSLAVQVAAQAATTPLPLTGGMAARWVEGLVRSHILHHWETQDHPVHLRTIRDRLLWHKQRTERILSLYQQILQGKPVYSDHSQEQADLLLSGLVVRRDDQLVIKNPIYRQVFAEPWLQRQRSHPPATALEV